MEFANGDRFKGSFVDGSIEGYGVWHAEKTGAMYHGTWKGSQVVGNSYWILTANCYIFDHSPSPTETRTRHLENS